MSVHLSKCHVVGNHVSQLNCVCKILRVTVVDIKMGLMNEWYLLE